MSDRSNGDPRFIIIGAGMAGILSAIELKQAGLDDFVIYEKADRLGGTWRENTYPGIACDVPSHLYSYSFALNPDWSRQFSPGTEIQEYFTATARRFGVDSRIRFNEEVTRCDFENGRWHVETGAGTVDEGDFVIAATGVLHHPNIPEIEGADSFAGAVFHSARWDHDVEIDGKRVAVVGTGSSAIQIVSALVERVAHLTLFQRTPQWVMPVPNAAYSEAQKKEFADNPTAIQEVREAVSRAFTDGFANILVDSESPMLQAIHDACVANLENSVTDPELREKLRPTYRAACKRLVMSPNFYEAIQQPNAELVTEPIERLEGRGVRTADGRLHELDVVVLATGFRVDRFVRPMRVRGRGGVELDAVWSEGPTAYLAITVPDFPNFFMLNGPNGPVGNFSLIDVVEMQFAYIMQLVEQVRSGACREISVSTAAMRRFDQERIDTAQSTIWATGCRSWYLDARGVPTAWPWTFNHFIDEMKRPRLADYDLR